MSKIKITFHKCLQDSQELGSYNEYMVSRVYFSIDENGKKHQNLLANIKQTVGSDYESGSIEVSNPINYTGPNNYAEYSKVVMQYFGSLVGSSGSGIHIGTDCSILRMMNNTYIKESIYEFETN